MNRRHFNETYIICAGSAWHINKGYVSCSLILIPLWRIHAEWLQAWHCNRKSTEIHPTESANAIIQVEITFSQGTGASVT